MIFDLLTNISKYSEIPDSVVNFITTLTADVPTGKYQIEDGIFANIDEYTTKSIENTKMEAHKDYIDIQFLLRGTERLDVSAISMLTVSEQYDSERDVMFFYPPEIYNTHYLDTSNFILLYPQDAHRPQIAFPAEVKVKKVVVKMIRGEGNKSLSH